MPAPARHHWPQDAIASEEQLAAGLRQKAAEARVAGKRALELERRNAVLESERRSRVTVTREPRTYEPGSRCSFFVDLARAERRSDPAATARLERHKSETAVDDVRRNQAQTRAAAAAWEAEFYATPGDRRAVDNYLAGGGQIFETRALGRADGQGGYLVPPAWLVDQYVPPARTGTELASLFTTLPLPPKCDTINVPRAATGTRTGVQVADFSPVPGVDLTDSFASSNVRTITGIQDAAAQWIEQGSAVVSGGLDRIIFDDLQADAGIQLDGQLWTGSGTNGQLSGLLPPQTTIGTSLAVYAPNGNTSSNQTLSYAGTSGTSLLATIAQGISGVGRARGKYPTHLVSHSWVWAMAASSVDQQSRPLVLGKGPGSAAPAEDGILGEFPGTGLPFAGDMNCPVSFGNASPNAPYMAATSGAQFAWTAGTGSYTPIVALHAPSMYLWAGRPQLRCLSEVLSGSLQIRYQIIMYVAAVVSRYVAGNTGTMANSGGWASGASTAYGVITQFGSNSLLSVSNFGG